MQGRGPRSWTTQVLTPSENLRLSLPFTFKREVCRRLQSALPLLPVRQEVTSLAKITSYGQTPRPHRKEHVFPRRLGFEMRKHKLVHSVIMERPKYAGGRASGGRASVQRGCVPGAVTLPGALQQAAGGVRCVRWASSYPGSPGSLRAPPGSKCSLARRPGALRVAARKRLGHFIVKP